ncbi:hypothetical protein [Mycobacterium sp. IS-1556]|uniref:hypothetical protein n=1 Tax=Mycobacterium sp. IS-1556 TaxID=1772276 RepID=UPI000A5C9E14|nr:hypothetical protein [Mycobacterium sp. IS-1556]
MKCKKSTQATAQSLTITTEAVSELGRCQVSASGRDAQKVTARNWTNSPYEIAVLAKCGNDLRYCDSDGTTDVQWNPDDFTVPSNKPGWGTPQFVTESRSKPIKSLRRSTDQIIDTTVNWGYPGTTLAASESISISVDTVEPES